MWMSVSYGYKLCSSLMIHNLLPVKVISLKLQHMYIKPPRNLRNSGQKKTFQEHFGKSWTTSSFNSLTSQ